MINLTEITGFRGPLPLEITDHHGRAFYIKNRSSNGSKFVHFNLPAGKYNSSVPITTLRRPIKYLCGKLPIAERILDIPELNVHIEENPHKCTVYFKTGDIIMDPSMAVLPKPNLLHILFHEIAHFYYKTEWKCDMFACKQMLKIGYNPSQCLKVMIHNLSSNKKETVFRATKNLNYLKNVTWLL